MTNKKLITRRLALAAGGALLAGGAQAQANSWPTRPVRIIVPFAAGGPADALARMLAEIFGPQLGQPVVVENRAGAGGILGTQAAAQANDGHTLLFGSVSMTIVPHLQPQPLAYDVVRDFAPLGLVASTPFVLVVPTASPLRSVADVVAEARKGGMAAANSGHGTISHLTAEMFGEAAGVRIEPVVYRGEGVLMPDLLNGAVPMGFLTLSTVLPQIQAGRLRALAIAGAARLAVLPDVPSLAEQGFPGIEADGWQALFAPRSVPEAGVQRLVPLLRDAVASAALRERITGFGAIPGTRDRAEFAAMFPQEYQRWGAVVRARGIQAQ
ncbi:MULTISPECIES: Bug family tripartite tricarboxylate transporter substrate binding protein [Roseomonadaceae]|uniref:Tripartite tricarboxylate transporter substrate binding protein n=1 Tax=Falsiroseomonas oleicola TaxID=2801474 RepID=A0ABS6HAR1_9PROT|nr:tripartite tricarboxylate transporter substrate binding protein [Roseomonas oleicola]MBU8544571.1 tripartite tricarboxylate transporter substrate binding protein [Roseomonas oleicola]